MSNTQTQRWVVALMAAAVTRAAPLAHGGEPVPGGVALDGYLSTLGKGPAPDGTYNMTFRLYGKPVGDTARFTEVASVKVLNGIFTWSLGSSDGTSLSKLKATLSEDGKYLPTLYIGVQVGSDPEYPRVELTAVPHAIAAGQVACSGCVSELHLDAALKAKLGGGSYSGKDFVLSNQACKKGDVVTGIDASGEVQCATDAGGAVATSIQCSGCIDGTQIANGVPERSQDGLRLRRFKHEGRPGDQGARCGMHGMRGRDGPRAQPRRL